MSTEKHNETAPELLRQLVGASATEAEAMVILESLTLGVMLYYRPKPREAAEYLDVMTAAIIERMQPNAAR